MSKIDWKWNEYWKLWSQMNIQCHMKQTVSTHKQIDVLINKRDGLTNWKGDKQTVGQANKTTNRQTHKKMGKGIDKQTDEQTDGKIER